MDKLLKNLASGAVGRRNQLGQNMIGLIIWMILAVVVMGGVVSLFVSTSHQTALGAEQTQQQQSILSALNRASRDVSLSDPILSANAEQIVLQVGEEDGTKVKRTYYLDAEDAEIRYFEGDITPSNDDLVIVRDVKDVDAPLFSYFDSEGTELIAFPLEGGAAETIARVDISVTANVANKGNVSLSTSAVPRSTTNLTGVATNQLAACPPFSAIRNPDSTVTLRWDKSVGATSYEITRNGVFIREEVVTDEAKLEYGYTDAPPQSGTVMNYMLKVVSPAGISNCVDSVTPIVTEVGATQITAGLIPVTELDAAYNPISTAWTGVGPTQVKLDWRSVEGATEYDLYKRQLDASGNYIGSNIFVATVPDSDKSADGFLTYTAETDWQERWEWRVKVLSRTGENTKTPPIVTLSYPAPVNDVTISALPVDGSAGSVSSADLAAGYGNTKLEWNYTEGIEARGFDIYRSALDDPATGFPTSFTKIGEVDAGTFQYIDTKAELGSTYGYYIVGKNKSGFGNQYMSQRVEQLQYPPIPSLVSVSATGSRDLQNRTNRVMWNDAKSADGYHVVRQNMAGQLSCLTGDCAVNSGGITATQLVDSDSSVVLPATRFAYGAYSYNETGLSPEFSTTVTLTQRPATPTLTKTVSPTLDSLQTKIDWDANAGSWCRGGAYSAGDEAAINNCAYQQVQYNNNGSVKYTGNIYGNTVTYGNQEWGKHYTYSVRSRNAAITGDGWSDYSGKVAADTYPGPFSINSWLGNSSGANAQRLNYTSKTEFGGWGDVSRAGYTAASWSGSSGAGTFTLTRRAHASQSWSSAYPERLLPDVSQPVITWDGTRYTRNNGTSGASSYNPETSGTSSYIAAPGALYSYLYTMKSEENSLTRSLSTSQFRTPADIPTGGAVQVVCSGPQSWYDPSVSFPRQLISSRLNWYNLDARYGDYDHTSITRRQQWSQGAGMSANGTFTVAEGASVPFVINASDGVGYFQYIQSGFRLHNDGAGSGPASATLIFEVSTYATFSDCAPEGYRGNDLKEPSDACYDYRGGVCGSLNSENRPKWLSQ